MKIKKIDTGEIITVKKYIIDGDGDELIWSNDWYGKHVIGKDCEWAEPEKVKLEIPSKEFLEGAYRNLTIEARPLYDWLLWKHPNIMREYEEKPTTEKYEEPIDPLDPYYLAEDGWRCSSCNAPLKNKQPKIKITKYEPKIVIEEPTEVEMSGKEHKRTNIGECPVCGEIWSEISGCIFCGAEPTKLKNDAVKYKYNINDYMYVQITDKGWEHLKNTVGNDYIKHSIKTPWCEMEINGEIWYRLQCHSVFNLFPVNPGFSTLIKTNVMFDNNSFH